MKYLSKKKKREWGRQCVRNPVRATHDCVNANAVENAHLHQCCCVPVVVFSNCKPNNKTSFTGVLCLAEGGRNGKA